MCCCLCLCYRCVIDVQYIVQCNCCSAIFRVYLLQCNMQCNCCSAMCSANCSCVGAWRPAYFCKGLLILSILPVFFANFNCIVCLIVAFVVFCVSYKLRVALSYNDNVVVIWIDGCGWVKILDICHWIIQLLEYSKTSPSSSLSALSPPWRSGYPPLYLGNQERYHRSAGVKTTGNQKPKRNEIFFK